MDVNAHPFNPSHPQGRRGAEPLSTRERSFRWAACTPPADSKGRGGSSWGGPRITVRLAWPSSQGLSAHRERLVPERDKGAGTGWGGWLLRPFAAAPPRLPRPKVRRRRGECPRLDGAHGDWLSGELNGGRPFVTFGPSCHPVALLPFADAIQVAVPDLRVQRRAQHRGPASVRCHRDVSARPIRSRGFLRPRNALGVASATVAARQPVPGVLPLGPGDPNRK